MRPTRNRTGHKVPRRSQPGPAPSRAARRTSTPATDALIASSGQALKHGNRISTEPASISLSPRERVGVRVVRAATPSLPRVAPTLTLPSPASGRGFFGHVRPLSRQRERVLRAYAIALEEKPAALAVRLATLRCWHLPAASGILQSK